MNINGNAQYSWFLDEYKRIEGKTKQKGCELPYLCDYNIYIPQKDNLGLGYYPIAPLINVF